MIDKNKKGQLPEKTFCEKDKDTAASGCGIFFVIGNGIVL